MTDPQTIELLSREKYVRLTTFKRDGTAVPTPVWLVRDGEHLCVVSAGVAGKVKRLRHTPRVLLAPCDARGGVKPGVADVEATAAVITDRAEVDRLEPLFKQRYGFMYTLVTIVQRFRGMPPEQDVEIRITL